MTQKQRTPYKNLDADGLTVREALFCRLYLINKGIGTQAAREAGFKSPSERACRLLSEERIMRVIRRERARVFDQLDIKADKVLRELARIAFFDPRRLFNTDGTMVPVPQLDDDTAAVISGAVVRPGGRGMRLRFANKLQALDMLGQYLKLWDGGAKSTDRLQEVINAMREGPVTSIQ